MKTLHSTLKQLWSTYFYYEGRENFKRLQPLIIQFTNEYSGLSDCKTVAF